MKIIRTEKQILFDKALVCNFDLNFFHDPEPRENHLSTLVDRKTLTAVAWAHPPQVSNLDNCQYWFSLG